MRARFGLPTLSLLAAALAVLAGGPATAAPRFRDDDPLRQDDDRIDTPVKPEEVDYSLYYDLFGNQFHDFGPPETSEAQNVNTLDEVPDSSWFTNRHGHRPMPLDELLRGADQGSGPVLPLTVTKAKSAGVSPGLEVADAKGDRYLVKFDIKGLDGVSTTAEVIATKFFWAMGYSTPENYLIDLDPKALAISDKATLKDQKGVKHKLTPGSLRWLLRRAARSEDGTLRAIASKLIAGEVIGPFRYRGMRPDDPNDVIPHELRRELRGLRVFAAWLNHTDARAANTLGTWVEDEGGRHHVEHYLIDFGACIGSGQLKKLLGKPGYDYLLDVDGIPRRAVSLGFSVPRYRTVDWPPYKKYRGVGRYESETFDPALWRGDYPNPAFVRMSDRDAFWASKIVMSFTPEEIGAVVRLAHLEPEAEQYLSTTILERQRKCGEVYLNRVNPLDRFEIGADGLRFTNLSEAYGVGAKGSTYEAQWHLYEPESDRLTPLDRPVSTQETRLALPPGARGSWVAVTIRTSNLRHPDWKRAVTVYLRPQPAPAGDTGAEGGFTVVGIDREAAPPPNEHPYPARPASAPAPR